MAPSYPRSLTRDEARRAIWLDFEGGKDKPPSLAGVLVDGLYSATILNPDFGSLAKTRKLVHKSFGDFVGDTLSTASQEERVIAAWSEHELNQMEGFDDRILKACYRNANKLVLNFFIKKRPKTMKKLRKQNKKDKAEGKRRNSNVGLKDLLGLDYIPYDYPDCLESFSPAKTISRMDGQLATHGGNYCKVAIGAKNAFTQLIEYNEHDCKGMACMVDYVFSRKPTETRIEH